MQPREVKDYLKDYVSVEYKDEEQDTGRTSCCYVCCLTDYTPLPNLYATLVADTGTKSLGTKSREVTIVTEEWRVVSVIYPAVGTTVTFHYCFMEAFKSITITYSCYAV